MDGLVRSTDLLTRFLHLILLASIAWAGGSQVALGAEKRFALIVGNAQYKHIGTLANSGNDARLMAEVLRRQGFDASLHIDADLKRMKRGLQDFFGKVQSAGSEATTLIYYAGHGVQVRGANYLIPVDAEINKEIDVDVEAIKADDIMSMIGQTGSSLNIVILDACRNNPFRGFRSTSRGLAQIDAPSGTLVAFSTSPGRVAHDGLAGGNSPYTTALARRIAEPGLVIEDVFKRVRQAVNAETRGEQVPWESSSLVGEFYPAGRKGTGTAAVAVPSGNADAAQAWAAAKDTASEGVLESLIKQYSSTI